jgi:hypothetical protein
MPPCRVHVLNSLPACSFLLKSSFNFDKMKRTFSRPVCFTLQFIAMWLCPLEFPQTACVRSSQPHLAPCDQVASSKNLESQQCSERDSKDFLGKKYTFFLKPFYEHMLAVWGVSL